MPDENQLEPLRDLLNARNELAHLVGKKSYSERANQESIFNNVGKFFNNSGKWASSFLAVNSFTCLGTITEFLNTLSEKIAPLAQEECDQMLMLKQKLDPQATEVYPWDTPYLTSLLRNERFDRLLDI